MSTAVLLKLVMILYLADYGETTCPDSNVTGPLKYSAGMNNATFAYPGSQKSLDCCITGYSSLAWAYRARQNDTWQQIGGTSAGVYRLQEKTRNQTLLIVPSNDAYPQQGYYRCTATNAQNHTLIRRIELCLSEPTGREHPQAYGPSSNACAKLGRTVSVNCTADFGVISPMLCDVGWYYDDNGNLSLVSNNSDSRINTIVVNNGTTEHFTLQLVIRNVTEADVNKTFRCYASSIRDNYNQNFKFVVKLCGNVVQITPVNKVTVGVVAGGVVVMFVLLTVLSTVIVCLYKPQILYKLQHVWDRQGEWIPLNEGQYDTLLFHSDVSGDCDLGTRLESDLNEADYTVARYSVAAPENEENVTVNSIIEDFVRNSAALVIVSPSDGSDEDFLARLQFIRPLIEPKNVTVTRHQDGGQESHPDLRGYKHLTYEPPEGNRRQRKNFLCALKLRIEAAKKRRRTMPDRHEGVV